MFVCSQQLAEYAQESTHSLKDKSQPEAEHVNAAKSNVKTASMLCEVPKSIGSLALLWVHTHLQAWPSCNT